MCVCWAATKKNILHPRSTRLCVVACVTFPMHGLCVCVCCINRIVHTCTHISIYSAFDEVNTRPCVCVDTDIFAFIPIHSPCQHYVQYVPYSGGHYFDVNHSKIFCSIWPCLVWSAFQTESSSILSRFVFNSSNLT